MSEKCQHYWNMVHAVYGGHGPRGEYYIRRWCPKCETEQVGEVTRWRSPRPDEFDHAASAVKNRITLAEKDFLTGLVIEESQDDE